MSSKDITKRLSEWVPRWLKKIDFKIVLREVPGIEGERADFMGYSLCGSTRLVEVKASVLDARSNVRKAHHRDSPMAMGDERWMATTREVFAAMRKEDVDLWTAEGWGIVTFGYGWETYETEVRAVARKRASREADIAALVRMIDSGGYSSRRVWCAS